LIKQILLYKLNVLS